MLTQVAIAMLGALTQRTRRKGKRERRENLVFVEAGELSRLIHIPAKDLEKNRLKAAANAADKIGGVILFKGFHTVVHSAGINYIIASGNPSLAKSGTGDVLSGLIGSYLAQGLSSEKAAVLGAWIHGDLADQRIRQGKSLDSLMASDLIEGLKNL